jgi:3D (Asp-Asp-Asp) domain-containing protein
MVLYPAPKPCHEAASDWTHAYRALGISRFGRRVLVASLSLSALFGAGFWSRSDAEVVSNAPVSRSAESAQTVTASQAPAAPVAVSSVVAKAKPVESPSAKVPVVAPLQLSVSLPVVALKTSKPSLRTLTLTVRAGNFSRPLKAHASPNATVAQALAAGKFNLGPLDLVQPARNSRAYEGMNVQVTRVSATPRLRYQYINAETRYKPTPSIARGTQQTLQYGRAGVITITERVWKRDGKVSKVDFVSRKVTRPVQHTLIALGTKANLMPSNVRYHKRYARAYRLASRGGSPRDRFESPELGGALAPANPGTLKAVRSLSVVSTGYAAGPAGGAIGNWTATGVRCGYGAVAVDPRVIPLGSKLYIEGYGYGFACDTGGAIKGARVDLAFDSVRAAFAHGRRRVTVWVLQ